MSKLAIASSFRHIIGMSLLDLVRRYKHFDFAGFTPVHVAHDGKQTRVGWTKPELAKALAGYGYVFVQDGEKLVTNPELMDYRSRTEAIDAVLRQASNEGYLPAAPDFSAIGGIDWFAIGPRHAPLFEMQRFYATHLGVRRYGSRVNGYHNNHMWIVRRGLQVHEYPGALDTLVGAAQIAGRTIHEHVLVEAHEEAGLTPPDCQNLKFVSMYHIARQTGSGYYFDENIYMYDLDTRGVITPRIMQTWETEAIELWPYDKVLQTLYHTEDFRPEAAFCLLDFFIRHGVITPDNEPDFDELYFGIHGPVPVPEARQ